MIKHATLILALVLMVSIRAQANQAAATRPAAGASPAPAAGKPEISPTVAAFMKPLDIASSDDPVRQKLKERHNTAVRLLELRVEGYRKGLNEVSSIFEAAQLVGQSKMDLAQQVKERDQVIEQLLEVSQTIESRLEQLWKKGITSEADVLRARFARQGVEAELLKLRKSGAAPTTQPR